jgi:hypothetical protein
MARIELRNTTVRLVDGYSNEAQVLGSPSPLDTEIEIDQLETPGIVPPSARFTVVGSADLYTVQDQDANAQLSIDLNSAGSGSGELTIAGADAVIPIAFDDDAAAVLASIEADANIAPGDFSVAGAGTAGDPFLITALPDGSFEDQAVAMSFAQGTLDTVPVTSQTYAGGVTHHITFSPAFATAHTPIDNAVITFTGRTLSVKVGDGTATYSQNKEYNYDLDRDDLDTVRRGAAQPMDWTLDLVWEFLTAVAGAETPTPEDVLDRVGPAADWVSSSADPCEDYAVDIEIEQNQPCGNEDIEVITIPDARYEALDHDVREATVSASGRSNAERAIKTRRPKIAIV